jgi:hypothetical protein
MEDSDSEHEGRAKRPRRAESAEGAPDHEPARPEASPYLQQQPLPQRKVLGHEGPSWVSHGTIYWPHVFDAFAVDGTARTPRPT